MSSAYPQPDPPCVLAVIGLPSSGKAELAIALAETLGLRLVIREWIGLAMFQEGGDPSPARFAPDEIKMATASALAATRVNLLLGHSTVLDDAELFHSKVQGTLHQIVTELGCGLRFIYVDCPPSLAAVRLGLERSLGFPLPADTSSSGVMPLADRLAHPPRGSLVIPVDIPLEAQVKLVTDAWDCWYKAIAHQPPPKSTST